MDPKFGLYSILACNAIIGQAKTQWAGEAYVLTSRRYVDALAQIGNPEAVVTTPEGEIVEWLRDQGFPLVDRFPNCESRKGRVFSVGFTPAEIVMIKLNWF